MKTPENKAYALRASLPMVRTGAVLLVAIVLVGATIAPPHPTDTEQPRRAQGVCPPYELRDVKRVMQDEC